MIPQWAYTHTHTSQSGEYSMAITQSFPSYCHSHLLPFLITAPSPFSLSPLPPLQPNSPPLQYYYPPFFLLYTHTARPHQQKWTEFLRTQIGGVEAGGLTRFLHRSDVLGASDSMFAEWFQYTSHDWNREVIFHMCTPVRAPALDSTYLFFFTSPWTCENGLMENTIVAFQRLYSTSMGALLVCLFGQM